MKKNCFVNFLMFLCCISISISSANAITIGIVPESLTIEMGETFTVDILASDLGNFAPDSLGSYDLDILYNTSTLAFIDHITVGPFLGDIDMGEAIDLSGGEDLADPGSINIAELSLLEPDFGTCLFCEPPYLDEIQPDNFVLATLQFDAVFEGSSDFDITVLDLTDGFGSPFIEVNFDINNVTVVSGQVPVPEPATILLLASGMAGLGVFGRKKFKQ